MNELVPVALGTLVGGWLLTARWRRVPGVRPWFRGLIAGLVLLSLVPGWRSLFQETSERTQVVLVDLDRRQGSDFERLLDPAWWREGQPWDREIVLGVGKTPVLLHDGEPATGVLTHPSSLAEATFRDGARPDLALRRIAGLVGASDPVHLVVVGGEDWDWRSMIMTRADPEAIALASARRVASPPSRRENLGLRLVAGPPVVRPGADVAVEFELDGRVGVRRVVDLRIVGGEGRSLSLEPGDERRRVLMHGRVDAGGRLVAEIAGQEAWDDDPTDDRVVVPVPVAAERPRIMRVGRPGGDWPQGLEDWLGPLPAPVSVRAAAQDLTGTDLVVLEDLAAEDAGARAFTDRLEDFVGSGGAVLILGADRAFGAGAWDESVLDRLSPLGARPEGARRRVQVLLDRSGSMDGERFRAAAAAVLGVHDSLRDGDSLRLVLFGTEVEVSDWSGGDSNQALRDRLAKTRPAGGTLVGPALDLALSAPAAPDLTSIVLLLTDAADPKSLTAAAFDRWENEARDGRHAVFVFWFDRDGRGPEAGLQRLAAAGGGKLIAIDDFARLREPFVEAAERGLRIEPAAVHRLDGGSARVARLLRTRRRAEAEVLAAQEDATAALARVRRGAGWVAAAPVPPTAESFEALLGSPADRAAFILGLTGERAALGTQLEVITDAAGDPTYRLLAPGMVARSLELVVPGKAAILLVPRGPDRWESRPGNPRYEPQTVSLRDESGMTLARLWLTPGYPVLDQGGRSPPAAALKGLLTAGPRSGAPGKLPRGMLLLALLLLLADLGLRLRFGR